MKVLCRPHRGQQVVVVSSTLVLIGLKVAAKPADDNHPQGHGKAEPLVTVMVSLFPFLAAYEIGRQSIHDILNPHTPPAPWTLAVLVGVVVVKEGLARFIARIAGETGTGAVKADAQHQRADVVTTAAAFLGIAVALVGSHFSPDPRWSNADDWAALFASGFAPWNGFGIVRGALHEPTDAHPGTALTVPGVDSLDECFVRKMGFDYCVGLDAWVNPQMTALQAHVADKRFAPVLVHIEPTVFPVS